MKNIGDMFKQFQDIQGKVADMEQTLKAVSCEGQAAAGAVRVILDGKGNMAALHIDPAFIDSAEVGVLEDLIRAAHGDAKARVEKAVAEQMSSLTGGLPLPPGMKPPF